MLFYIPFVSPETPNETYYASCVLHMDSDGHGQYLGQYLAPSEDLVTFGALCDVLEHF